jgi:DNA-directed RNA polymerase specialized sigma24 family protein
LSSEDALSHTADVEGDPSGEPPPSTPQPTEVPPELKAVPDSELLEVFEAARAVALRKTKSRVEADVLVSDVFIKLTTTRRWDPQKAPLLPYFLLVVESEFLNRVTSAAPEREDLAHEGFHREVRPDHSPSPEDSILEHAAQQGRRDESRAELDALKARIAKHPLMPRVLECRDEGMTPAETARFLKVSDREVYSAIKLLKRHLARIRENADRQRADGGGKT